MGIFTKAVSTIARGLGLNDHRLVAHFAGEPTDAGETITVDSSLQIGTVWACVRLIAQTIATLPLHTYRKADNGGAAIARDHDLYRLLHERPNYDMTSVEFWEAVVAAILLWGNAFIAIRRVGARIVALYPMRPDRVVRRLENDGSLTYFYTWGGKTEKMKDSDVLHIKGFSLDGHLGISVVAMARNNMGAARAAERASSAIFRNGMRPSGTLTAPDYLTAEQRIDAQAILNKFKGANATGSVPLLEGGWKFDKLSIDPDDAQMLETQAFHVEQLCRWFDVPPIMIGHQDKQSSFGTGVEQIMLHFYRTCLQHHISRIEKAVNGSLFTPEDRRKGFYASFNVAGLLRADHTGRASYYTSMVQNGIMTRNEVRRLENLPEIDGADELTVQSNLTPLEDLAAVIAGRQPSALPGRQNGSPTPIPEIRQ